MLRTPLRDVGRGIAALATLPRRTLDATPLIDQVAALGRIAKRHGVHTLDRSVIADRDVAAAIAEIVDGATPAEVTRLLDERRRARILRHAAAADMWAGMAEVAPAMGMVGTLIGLVKMFLAMADPAAIGAGDGGRVARDALRRADRQSGRDADRGAPAPPRARRGGRTRRAWSRRSPRSPNMASRAAPIVRGGRGMSDDALLDPPPARPLWLWTLADLALLLVGFFVLVQATDRQALAKGLREGFGGDRRRRRRARSDPARRRRGRRSRPARRCRKRPTTLIDFATANLRDPRASLRVSGGTDGAGDVDPATGSADLLADRPRPRGRLLSHRPRHRRRPHRHRPRRHRPPHRARHRQLHRRSRRQDKTMIRSPSSLAALVAATPAAAQSFQSTTLIDKAVAGFTGRAHRRGWRRAHRRSIRGSSSRRARWSR